jgi:hypothetical protein
MLALNRREYEFDTVSDHLRPMESCRWRFWKRRYRSGVNRLNSLLAPVKPGGGMLQIAYLMAVADRQSDLPIYLNNNGLASEYSSLAAVQIARRLVSVRSLNSFP